MDYTKLLEQYFSETRVLGNAPKEVLRTFVMWLNQHTAQQSVEADGDAPRCEGCGGVLIMFSRYCHVCGRPRR